MNLLPPNLPELLPEARQHLQRWAERRALNLYAPPLTVNFPYQNLPPSARLTYELVGWHNFPVYLPLFAADSSPFVDARFQQQAALELYAADLLTDMRYSWKRGGCDWLVRRLDEQPVGVLHLYELSHEVINGQVPFCSVGYAVAAPFRQLGYGTEMLAHLLAQAAGLFERTEARALTNAANAASGALLRKVGFTVLEERTGGRGHDAYTLWQRYLG